METQNSMTTVQRAKTAAKKFLGVVRATVEKLIDVLEGWPALDSLLVSDEIPVLIRPKVNTDIDIANDELANYLPSAKNETLEVRARRDTLQSPLRIITAWMLATLAIIGFLTLMLIAGIAISV